MGMAMSRLPITTLKIDRSLIKPLGRDYRARIIVKNICATCSELGVEVVAEGVDRYQSRILRELGCHVGQGYALARPTDIDTLNTEGCAL